MVTVDFNELYNSKIKEVPYRGLIDDIGDMVILLLRAYQDSDMMVNCCIQRYGQRNSGRGNVLRKEYSKAQRK